MHDDVATRQWLVHLTERDLELLSRLAPRTDVDADRLRTDPDALTRVLGHEAVHDAAFGESADEPFLLASPFLVFALITHRSWNDLGTVQAVDEWVGARQRLPVLSSGQLMGFLDRPAHRLFITELLASYTRVVSTITWTRTRRGWRRRKFSELDPVRLASLLELVPETEHAGVYRRLGDLALFRTGVFPDHTELNGLGSLEESRLLRLSGVRPEDIPSAVFSGSTVKVFEHLGEHWYGRAARSAAGPLGGTMNVVADVAEQFVLARRVLNFIADRYLFGERTHWFAQLPS